MEDQELLNRIKEIVYDVPDGLYKYPKPGQRWSDEMWLTKPSTEKGFILIKELIENVDIQNYEIHDKCDETININVLNLGHGPTFWTQADEDMFFNAIYSLASYIKIIGEGRNLYLHHQGQFSKEEKDFLVGLLKRYQMKIPKELTKNQ